MDACEEYSETPDRIAPLPSSTEKFHYQYLLLFPDSNHLTRQLLVHSLSHIEAAMTATYSTFKD